MNGLAVAQSAATVGVNEMRAVQAAAPDFEGFYRAEMPRLRQTLYAYCGDAELATELAQEAMAKAWRHWSRVSGLNSPGGWTCRVALNMANAVWRRALVIGRVPADGREAAVTSPPDSATSLTIRQAVSRLPRRQRAAVVLRYFADLGVEDTARAMGCRPGTVKAATAKAIEALRTSGVLSEGVAGVE